MKSTMKNTSRFNQAMTGWLLHSILMLEIFRYAMDYQELSELLRLFVSEWGISIALFAGFLTFVVMCKNRD